MRFDTVELDHLPCFMPIMASTFSLSSRECMDITVASAALNLTPTRIWEQKNPSLIGVKKVCQRVWDFDFFPQNFIFSEDAVSLVLKRFYPLHTECKRLFDEYPIEAIIHIRVYVTNHSKNTIEFVGNLPIVKVNCSMMRQMDELGAELQIDFYSIDAFEKQENIKIISYNIECDDYIEGNDKSYWVLDADNCKYSQNI